MQKVRWGVLGLAAIATTRTIPAFDWVEGAALAAIASRDADKARRYADAHGIARAWGSYEALLDDPEIDAVYIPLPNNLHFEWSPARARSRQTRALRKAAVPLGRARCVALIDARDRTGRHIEEAFSTAIIRSGRDRRLLGAGDDRRAAAAQGTMARQFLDPNDIRNNPDAGRRRAVRPRLVHHQRLHLAFRRAPRRVVAALERDPMFGIDRLPPHCSTTAMPRELHRGVARSGRRAARTSSSRCWAPTAGCAATFPYRARRGPRACHVFVGDHASAGSCETASYAFEPVNQYTLQVERFSRYLRGEPAPSWPIEDSLITLRIIEALFASARDGGWVGLERDRSPAGT